MKLALFSGCKIPAFLEQYEMASRAVMEALGIDLVEIRFNCCGYPNRDAHFGAYILSAARNLALAGQRGLNLLTLCKCCYGSLKHADHWLRNNKELQTETNNLLQEEDLRWEGNVTVKHLLPFLAREIGTQRIKDSIRRPYNGLKIAAHYGCHAIRPGSIMQFDNPLAPTLFEELVGVTGAEALNWPKRLDCCGNPLMERNPELGLALMHSKLEDVRTAGADYLCSACTHCQIQFDTIQAEQSPQPAGAGRLASILYPQLLGLTFGIEADALGLEMNKISIANVKTYLG